MKFEKDSLTLFIRIILIFILFVLINLLFLTFISTNKEKIINWISILIYSGLLTIFFLLFLTQNVLISNEKLILKNIFGMTINKLDLKKQYLRKIKKRNAAFEGEVIIGLFRKKYGPITTIYFKSEYQKKKIWINGHILTDKGIDNLIKSTKKRNLC
ncbi:hypothetical protein [Tenacibaculum amylolyticum]|uniref:hypothetical protein n=1 Tax=Tenacibaculum amylolyticum TaxID=104269 RepID=UPI0038941AE9